jgi:uncharacterized protein YciI
MTTYYAVSLVPGSKWDRSKTAREQAYWGEHAQFMDLLFEAGAIVLGGPFADRSGSLVVVKAETAKQVQAMFADDPWATHDVLTAGEIKEWTIFLDGRGRS